MKIGLVLEGGAMRGMYTAGVLDVLMENEIKADSVVGVSAGALFGVNFLSGQRGRVIRYNKRFNGDKRYMGLYPLLREGNIVNTQYAYHEVPFTLDPFDDEAYRKSEVPFYAVVTSLVSGKPEYLQVHSVLEQMDTLRASGSMPFVSRPVTINGEQYLDGAIADSIPFEWMSAQGYDKIIVVLTRDMTYRKKPMWAPFIKLCYGKYPEFAGKLRERHDMYNSSIDRLIEWEKQGKALVIRPSAAIDMGRLESDPDKLQQVYELGRNDCKQKLESLCAYIGREYSTTPSTPAPAIT